jgi:pilus assembly protein Flp/PilA
VTKLDFVTAVADVIAVHWTVGYVHVGCSMDMSVDCGKFPPERLITPRPAMPQQLTPAALPGSAAPPLQVRGAGRSNASRPWSDLMLKSYVRVQTFLSGLLNRDDRGATAVEYGLLVALIALVIIGVVTLLGTSLKNVFGTVASSVSSAG